MHLVGRGAELDRLVLPRALPVARLARGLALRRGDDLVDHGLLLLHLGERHVRAGRRLVAARLAREAAVEVAHGALVVALERVEVVVVAGLLRVPGVEAGLLGLEAPDVAEGRDVSHLRLRDADRGARREARGEARGERESGSGSGEHDLRRSGWGEL